MGDGAAVGLGPVAGRTGVARSRAGAVLAGAAIGGRLLLLHRDVAAGAGQALDVAAHAVYPYQLFSPAWSFGISTPGWQGDLPLQLGLAALALAMVTVILGAGSLPHTRDNHPARRQSSRCSPRLASPVVGLILILLTTTLARPLWRTLPVLASTLTYPWQLFALVGPLLAMLAGAVLVVERRLALLPLWAGPWRSSCSAAQPIFRRASPR